MKCNSPSLAIDNLSKAGSSHPIEEEKQTRQNKQTITAISKLTNWQKHVYIQGLAKCDDVSSSTKQFCISTQKSSDVEVQ